MIKLKNQTSNASINDFDKLSMGWAGKRESTDTRLVDIVDIKKTTKAYLKFYLLRNAGRLIDYDKSAVERRKETIKNAIFLIQNIEETIIEEDALRIAVSGLETFLNNEDKPAYKDRPEIKTVFDRVWKLLEKAIETSPEFFNQGEVIFKEDFVGYHEVNNLVFIKAMGDSLSIRLANTQAVASIASEELLMDGLANIEEEYPELSSGNLVIESSPAVWAHRKVFKKSNFTVQFDFFIFVESLKRFDSVRDYVASASAYRRGDFDN